MASPEDGSSTTGWHLYPPPVPESVVQVGHNVFYRPNSAQERGRVGAVVKIFSTSGKPRASVRFYEGGEKNVPLKRLVPVYHIAMGIKEEKPIKILLTSETIHYRHLCASQVNANSSILEVGCSTGEASAILMRYCRYTNNYKNYLGLDTSADMIATCKQSLPSCKDCFYKMNALMDPKGTEALVRSKLSVNPNFPRSSGTCPPRVGPCTVFLDIGGNRELEGVLKMTDWVRQCFGPRLIVIKSRELCKRVKQEETKGIMAVASSGEITGGHGWFQRQLEEQRSSSPRAMHPLKAPLVFSPSDGKTPICRYHNYHPLGCLKDGCPRDHEYCHACREAGHIARQCPNQKLARF